eukprot:758080-Hanusia_phi.AAC.9
MVGVGESVKSPRRPAHLLAQPQRLSLCARLAFTMMDGQGGDEQGTLTKVTLLLQDRRPSSVYARSHC